MIKQLIVLMLMGVFLMGMTVLAFAANNFDVKSDASSYLFVNGTTGNVGIGSALPQAKLDVEGNVYFGNGNVGINTVIARAALDIDGAVYMAGNVGIGTVPSAAKLYVDGGNLRLGYARKLEQVNNIGAMISYFYSAINSAVYLVDVLTVDTSNIGSTNSRITLFGNNNAKQLKFLTAASERVRIVSSGNVGIGTTVPLAPLQVNGSIYIPAGLGNIGVGTAEPRVALEVDGVIYGWNIGVGTIRPQALLEVGTATSIVPGSNPAVLVKNNVAVDGNVYATEFHLGANASIKYNGATQAIEF